MTTLQQERGRFLSKFKNSYNIMSKTINTQLATVYFLCVSDKRMII